MSIKNNTLIEKNNLNNNIIFINSNNSDKLINFESNNKQYNIEEFKQYIKSLPTSLVNYLCNSKGILEIQKILVNSNNNYNYF